MVELFRLWKLDCASGHSSAWAVALSLKKFGTPDRRFLRRSHSTAQRTACVVLFVLGVSKV